MSLRQLRAYIDQTADPLLQRFREQRHQAKQRGIPLATRILGMAGDLAGERPSGETRQA